MKRKTCDLKLFVVAVAMVLSTMAHAQQKDSEIDWMKDFTSRITLNGYAQAGWSYQDANSQKTNAYNLKRTLLWAKARITDRWSFLFMHDFSSVVQEFYTDYRLTNGPEMTVILISSQRHLGKKDPNLSQRQVHHLILEPTP